MLDFCLYCLQIPAMVPIKNSFTETTYINNNGQTAASKTGYSPGKVGEECLCYQIIYVETVVTSRLKVLGGEKNMIKCFVSSIFKRVSSPLPFPVVTCLLNC